MRFVFVFKFGFNKKLCVFKTTELLKSEHHTTGIDIKMFEEEQLILKTLQLDSNTFHSINFQVQRWQIKFSHSQLLNMFFF